VDDEFDHASRDKFGNDTSRELPTCNHAQTSKVVHRQAKLRENPWEAMNIEMRCCLKPHEHSREIPDMHLCTSAEPLTRSPRKKGKDNIEQACHADRQQCILKLPPFSGCHGWVRTTLDSRQQRSPGIEAAPTRIAAVQHTSESQQNITKHVAAILARNRIPIRMPRPRVVSTIKHGYKQPCTCRD
jgi:hypothetical protein